MFEFVGDRSESATSFSAMSGPTPKRASKRTLKRKSSQCSERSGARDVKIISGALAITGRCLKEPMYVEHKLVGSEAYAVIKSRTAWVHMMLNNVRRYHDYKQGYTLTMAYIREHMDELHTVRQVFDEPMCKSADDTDNVDPNDKADELSVSEAGRSDDDGEAEEVINDGDDKGCKGTSKTKLKSKLKEISMTVGGQDIVLLNQKKWIYIKFTDDNVRNFLQAIKFMQDGPPPSVDAPKAPPARVASSSASSVASDDRIKCNHLTRKFMIKYFDGVSELMEFLPIHAVSGEAFAVAMTRTRAEAQEFWNKMDKSAMARFPLCG